MALRLDLNSQNYSRLIHNDDMLEFNTVYTATSEEGFHFRLMLQELINDSPITYSCYDEEYLQYNLVLDNNCVSGKLMYLGEPDPEQDEPAEYDVIVEVETPHLAVNDNLLYVLHNGNYYLWADTYSSSIRDLIQCDEGYDVCKVMDLKYLKTTGNYRVKMMIEGQGYSRIWTLLMNDRGEILKKAEEFE